MSGTRNSLQLQLHERFGRVCFFGQVDEGLPLGGGGGGESVHVGYPQFVEITA